MIKTLTEDEQIIFDEKVRNIRDRAKGDLRLFSHLNGFETPNFTNYLKVIPYGEIQALVKTSKFFSDLFYNGKSLIESAKGKEANFLWDGQRQEFEGAVLEELAQGDILVPERVYTTVEGVLVVKYLQGEDTKLVLRDDSRFQETLSQLSDGLSQIHKIGLHGETSVNNTFVYQGNVYWVDFERFSRKNGNLEKAKELAHLVNSATRHSLRDTDLVKRVIFESYQPVEVIGLARNMV